MQLGWAYLTFLWLFNFLFVPKNDCMTASSVWFYFPYLNLSKTRISYDMVIWGLIVDAWNRNKLKFLALLVCQHASKFLKCRQKTALANYRIIVIKHFCRFAHFQNSESSLRQISKAIIVIFMRDEIIRSN